MNSEFIEAVCRSFEKEVIKKIIFSRPKTSEITKVSGRLCAHRGRKILALEYSLPGDTVSQKNVGEGELTSVLSELLSEYRQANLITTLGEAQWKMGNRSELVSGADRLIKRLSGERPDFERAIESLDRKKSRVLNGDEDFLIRLGVSDKTGRVHDKKQGKFRQICRFLEHIESVYEKLPIEGKLKIYDLCCGKSYLSFAVYYYLTSVKKREVELIGIDLKRDVIEWCDLTARSLGFSGMRFINDDITNVDKSQGVDMVISLHACDVATDIVLNTAAAANARVILSTPCCHRYMNGKIKNRELDFVTDYPQLSVKLCETFTDAIRLARLKKLGYSVAARELTDPENTPKNTILIAIRENYAPDRLREYERRYDAILSFVFDDKKDEYLSNLK